MKTLRRFIEEDDIDFDEAAESAVAKRKLLLNRLMKKKFPEIHFVKHRRSRLKVVVISLFGFHAVIIQ